MVVWNVGRVCAELETGLRRVSARVDIAMGPEQKRGFGLNMCSRHTNWKEHTNSVRCLLVIRAIFTCRFNDL